MVDDITRNEVALVGRMAAVPQERTLPSGDRLLSWRLVVDRPPPRKPPPEGVRLPTIDTLDCVAFVSSVRRVAGGFAAGDIVQVEGALRRRFWRAGAAAASRCEVEVAAVKRLAKAQVSR